MKHQNKLAMSVLMAASAYAGAASAVPLTQCPSIGFSPSCAILFTFNANGGISTTLDSTIGPYDGSDDVLVGVQNNSGATVNSLGLTGSGNGGGIFAFDGDGIQGYAGAPPGPYMYPTGYSPTGYEGPNTYFSNITTTNVGSDTGLVNFLNGLADGGLAYFGLESSPGSVNITPMPPGGGGGGGGPSVPEPGALGLLGLSLAMLGLGLRSRKKYHQASNS